MRQTMLAALAAGSLVACGGDATSREGGTQAVAADEAAVADEGTLCVLNTRLLPENEVRTAANAADPTVESTATGTAQVKVRVDGTIEFKVHILNRDGETFTAGHIHQAGPEANGPVVQGLFTGSTDERQFVQHGAVENATLGAALCATPSAYYVNYHTTQDPVGATRGQL